MNKKKRKATLSKDIYAGCTRAERRFAARGIAKEREALEKTKAVIAKLRADAVGEGRGAFTLLVDQSWRDTPGYKLARLLEASLPLAPSNQYLACSSCRRLVPADGNCPCQEVAVGLEAERT